MPQGFATFMPQARRLEGKRSFLPTLRCACRAGEGCGLVPGLLVRA